MTDSSSAAWWQRESHRDFTALERGLLGTMFAAIVVMVVVMVRYLVT